MIELLFILLGGVALVIFFFAVSSMVSHPADVDEEMTSIVAHETPEEHARALQAEHQKTPQEESQAEVELYGHDR